MTMNEFRGILHGVTELPGYERFPTDGTMVYDETAELTPDQIEFIERWPKIARLVEQEGEK